MLSQSVRPLAIHTGGFVVLAVLSFNFLGDGMRDAADPYGHDTSPILQVRIRLGFNMRQGMLDVLHGISFDLPR